MPNCIKPVDSNSFSNYRKCATVGVVIALFEEFRHAARGGDSGWAIACRHINHPEFGFVRIPRNPLKRPESDEGIQGIPSFFGLESLPFSLYSFGLLWIPFGLLRIGLEKLGGDGEALGGLSARWSQPAER
jgi:hypothetical protein